jgi:hypothetical protein
VIVCGQALQSHGCRPSSPCTQMSPPLRAGGAERLGPYTIRPARLVVSSGWNTAARTMTRPPLLALVLGLGLSLLSCTGSAPAPPPHLCCTPAPGSSPFPSQLELTIYVPHGWQARGFSNPARGVEITNVVPPDLVNDPGTPLQATGRRFPSNGIALVVYEGTWGGARSGALPLTIRDMAQGSCSAGAPCLDVGTFDANNHNYVVTAKIGSKASPTDRLALVATIRSIAVA